MDGYRTHFGDKLSLRDLFMVTTPMLVVPSLRMLSAFALLPACSFLLSGCNSAPAEAQATASAKTGAKIIPNDPPMDQALASDPLLGHDYVRVYDSGLRIPPRFRGVWAPDPASCSGDGGPLLIVGAADLRLPEGTRIPNRIEDFAADAVAIGFTRAGATPGGREPARLHISADKNRLFLLDEKIEPIGAGWVRCPDAD